MSERFVTIWAGRPTNEPEPPPWLTACRSWKWVLRVYWNRIGLDEMVLIPPATEWHLAVRYVTVWLDRYWRFGMRHDYYDGPHCQFSIGPIHLGWSLWWCKKCCPDDGCDP